MNEYSAFAGYGQTMPLVTMPIQSGGAPTPGATMDSNAVLAVDGTPVRVVILALAAAAGLTALKWAGFRFNVGVSA